MFMSQNIMHCKRCYVEVLEQNSCSCGVTHYASISKITGLPATQCDKNTLHEPMDALEELAMGVRDALPNVLP